MSATKTFYWYKRTCPGGAENNVYFPRLQFAHFFFPSIFSTERREIVFFVFFLSGVRTGDRRWMCDSQRQKDDSWQPSWLTARRTPRIFLSQMAPCGPLYSRQMEFELKWKVPSLSSVHIFLSFLVFAKDRLRCLSIYRVLCIIRLWRSQCSSFGKTSWEQSRRVLYSVALLHEHGGDAKHFRMELGNMEVRDFRLDVNMIKMNPECSFLLRNTNTHTRTPMKYQSQLNLDRKVSQEKASFIVVRFIVNVVAMNAGGEGCAREPCSLNYSNKKKLNVARGFSECSRKDDELRTGSFRVLPRVFPSSQFGGRSKI